MSAYLLGNAPNLYNADGSPAGQVGLDGKEYPSSVSGAGLPIRGAQLRGATFGDSTANFGEMGNGIGVTDQEYMTLTAAVAGTVAMACAGSKMWLKHIYPAFYPLANGGISGETTTQMLARDGAGASTTRRAVADVVSKKPDVVLLRGASINDILGLSLASLASDAQVNAIRDRRINLSYKLASGCGLVIDEGCAGFDASSGTPPANLALVRDCVARLNAALATHYATNAPTNIAWLTPVGLTCDSTGAYLPGYTLSTDGTHLSLKAQIVVAQAEKTIIEYRFGRSAKVAFPGQNLLTSLAYLPVAGSLPTGFAWSTAGTVGTATDAIELDAAGEVGMRRSVASAGASAQVNLALPLNIYTGAPSPAITVTSGMKLGVEFDWTVATNDGSLLLTGLSVNTRLDIRNTGTGRIVLDDGIATETGSADFGVSSMSGHFAAQLLLNDVTANIAATSSWQWQVKLPVLAAGYTLRVKNPRVVQLP